MEAISYNLTTREYQIGDAINQQLRKIHDNFTEVTASLVAMDKTEMIGLLPVASVAYRGKLYYVPGGVGGQDVLYICLKTELETYAWAEVPLNFV
jgi:hypothetical protein